MYLKAHAQYSFPFQSVDPIYSFEIDREDIVTKDCNVPVSGEIHWRGAGAAMTSWAGNLRLWNLTDRDLYVLTPNRDFTRIPQEPQSLYSMPPQVIITAEYASRVPPDGYVHTPADPLKGSPSLGIQTRIMAETIARNRVVYIPTLNAVIGYIRPENEHEHVYLNAHPMFTNRVHRMMDYCELEALRHTFKRGGYIFVYDPECRIPTLYDTCGNGHIMRTYRNTHYSVDDFLRTHDVLSDEKSIARLRSTRCGIYYVANEVAVRSDGTIDESFRNAFEIDIKLVSAAKEQSVVTASGSTITFIFGTDPVAIGRLQDKIRRSKANMFTKDEMDELIKDEISLVERKYSLEHAKVDLGHKKIEHEYHSMGVKSSTDEREHNRSVFKMIADVIVSVCGLLTGKSTPARNTDKNNLFGTVVEKTATTAGSTLGKMVATKLIQFGLPAILVALKAIIS